MKKVCNGKVLCVQMSICQISIFFTLQLASYFFSLLSLSLSLFLSSIMDADVKRRRRRRDKFKFSIHLIKHANYSSRIHLNTFQSVQWMTVYIRFHICSFHWHKWRERKRDTGRRLTAWRHWECFMGLREREIFLSTDARIRNHFSW